MNHEHFQQVANHAGLIISPLMAAALQSRGDATNMRPATANCASAPSCHMCAINHLRDVEQRQTIEVLTRAVLQRHAEARKWRHSFHLAVFSLGMIFVLAIVGRIFG